MGCSQAVIDFNGDNNRKWANKLVRLCNNTIHKWPYKIGEIKTCLFFLIRIIFCLFGKRLFIHVYFSTAKGKHFNINVKE